MSHNFIDKLSFLERNHRHRALFLILLRNDYFISTIELGEKLGVSSRTIKSDIKFIKYHLDIAGLEIVSKQSRGTRLIFKNIDIQRQIKEYFKVYSEDEIDKDLDKNVRYILRRLLSAKEPICVEKLQDELYINTSNYIHREIKQVKEVLNNYNLSINNVTKQGLVLEGSEYTKSLCILRLYRHFGDYNNHDFKATDFTTLFAISNGIKNIIREITCRELLKTRIVFSDIYLERFILYIILLSNKIKIADDKILSIDSFNYKVTAEYHLVERIDSALDRELESYKGGNSKQIKYLTYLAIMSTDLYRIKDCTVENYDTLIALASQVRFFIIWQFKRIFNLNAIDDVVLAKDLLKILIPIALKIKLKVSDDVDIGFYRHSLMDCKPLVKLFIQELSEQMRKYYQYSLSDREQYLLFNVINVHLNSIRLPHKKFKIAIIALDGRISTQQLKFCLRKYFEGYIERIETKILYELNRQENLTYDYYFSMEYGKNMFIPYSPIEFFQEGRSEQYYIEKLQNIFRSAYFYSNYFPKANYYALNSVYSFKEYDFKKHFKPGGKYFPISINKDLLIYISFTEKDEQWDIFFLENKDQFLQGKKYYMVISLNILGDLYKFKMLLNVINEMVYSPKKLEIMLKNKDEIIERIFNNLS